MHFSNAFRKLSIALGRWVGPTARSCATPESARSAWQAAQTRACQRAAPSTARAGVWGRARCECVQRCCDRRRDCDGRRFGNRDVRRSDVSFGPPPANRLKLLTRGFKLKFFSSYLLLVCEDSLLYYTARGRPASPVSSDFLQRKWPLRAGAAASTSLPVQRYAICEGCSCEAAGLVA